MYYSYQLEDFVYTKQDELDYYAQCDFQDRAEEITASAKALESRIEKDSRISDSDYERLFNALDDLREPEYDGGEWYDEERKLDDYEAAVDDIAAWYDALVSAKAAD